MICDYMNISRIVFIYLIKINLILLQLTQIKLIDS